MKCVKEMLCEVFLKSLIFLCGTFYNMFNE